MKGVSGEEGTVIHAKRIQYIGDEDSRQHLGEVALLVVGQHSAQTLGVLYVSRQLHVLVLVPETSDTFNATLTTDNFFIILVTTCYNIRANLNLLIF